MQVSIEEAYQFACRALGEASVKEQIMVAMLNEKDAVIKALNERLTQAEEAGFIIDEATEIVEGAGKEPNADRSDGRNGEGANGSVPHTSAPG